MYLTKAQKGESKRLDIQLRQVVSAESDRGNSILESLYADIGGARGFRTANSIQSLMNKIFDHFFTRWQEERDEEITKLLQCYVKTYENKSKSNPTYKRIIFVTCILILLAFSGECFCLILTFSNKVSSDTVNIVVDNNVAEVETNTDSYAIATTDNSNASNDAVHSNNLNGIVTLVTACATYLTLVISILKIITEYVFPQKEEDYITRIVESVQINDLANKKAYMDGLWTDTGAIGQNNQP